VSNDEILVVRAVPGQFSLVHRVVEVDACIIGPDELEKRWEHLS